MPDRPIKKYSTEVFLLFPECNDANRMMSAPYIKGYDFDFEECIPTGVSEIMEVVAFFAYERINYYYDSRNLDGLYYPNLICYDYPFVDTIVRASFGQFGIEDWRTYFGEDGTEIMWNGNPSINDTCAKVYERNNINNEFNRDDPISQRTSKEFMEYFYGDAAPYIQEYFDLCRRQIMPDTVMGIYIDQWNPLYTDDFIKEAASLLDKAVESVKDQDETIRHRTDLVKLQIQYLRTMRYPEETLADGTRKWLADFLTEHGIRVNEVTKTDDFVKGLR